MSRLQSCGDMIHNCQQESAHRPVYPDRISPSAYHRSTTSALQSAKIGLPKPSCVYISTPPQHDGNWVEKCDETSKLRDKASADSPEPVQIHARKPTMDAALCLAHDIHAADNHNIFMSLITKQDTSTTSTIVGY